MEPSEEEWQTQVVDRANGLGWICFFVPDWVWRLIFATMKKRRITKAWAARGFPDLVCRHADHGVIVAELKTRTGRTKPEQDAWLDDLKRAGLRVFLWRPEHEDATIEVLKGASRWQDDRKGGWMGGSEDSRTP